MSIDALPSILFSAFTSIIYSGLMIAGLMLVKSAKSWAHVAATALGVAAFVLAMNFGTHLLQGWERAKSMMLPGGEMFSFIGLPIVINSFITITALFCAVYGLFVLPGREKNV